MLDTQDIQMLREMFVENNQLIFVRMDQKIDSKIDGLRDEMDTRQDALKTWMETLLHRELCSMRDDIIEVINDGILPEIERLNIRVTRLERMQRQVA